MGNAIMGTGGSSTPSIQMIPSSQIYAPETTDALSQLSGMTTEAPFTESPSDTTSNYVQNLLSVYGDISPTLASSATGTAQQGGDITSQLISSLISPTVAEGMNLGNAEVAGGENTALNTLFNNIFGTLEPTAITSAKETFDTMAAQGMGASGVSDLVAENSFMNSIYSPLASGISNIASSGQNAENTIATGAANTLNTSGTGSLSTILQSALSGLGTANANLGGIGSTVSSTASPFSTSSALSSLLSSIISGGASIPSAIVSQESSTGAQQGLLGSFVGGLGKGMAT